MTKSLTEKQYIPLTHEEKSELQQLAKKHGISVGLLSRALLKHSLEQISDPAVIASIKAESEASTARTVQGAKTAAAARWGKDEPDG